MNPSNEFKFNQDTPCISTDVCVANNTAQEQLIQMIPKGVSLWWIDMMFQQLKNM